MIVALLLAAGLGRRFGGGKLIAPVQGTPLVRHAAEALLRSSVDEVVVVTGHDAKSVLSALTGLPTRIVHNAEYALGMGTSIAAGAAALPADATHALVVLADQPGAAEPAVVDRLVERAQRGDAAIVSARWRGTMAPPVCFSAAVFPELVALAGERGARALLERDPARVAWVELDVEPPTDVDTAADLRRLQDESAHPDGR